MSLPQAASGAASRVKKWPEVGRPDGWVWGLTACFQISLRAVRFEAVLKSVAGGVLFVGLPPIESAAAPPGPEAKQPFEHNGSEGLLSPDTPL